MLGPQKHLSEEKKLLSSSLGLNQDISLIEKTDKCDESINFDSLFKFEEEEEDNESSRQKQNDQKSNQTNNVDDNQNGFTLLNIFKKIKQFMKFNRKFLTFKQLYQQLFFDGILALYFLRMRSRCQNYVETSFKDEQLMIQISKELQKDSFHFYGSSKNGDKCLVWGKLSDWNDFVARRDGKIINQTPKLYTLSSFGNQKEIMIQVNNPSAVFDEEASLKTYTKRGIFYRLITSLYALNLFKIGFNEGNVQVKFGFIYAFGEKAITSDGQQMLKALRIFQRVNFKNYRRDQALFSAIGVIVGGFGLYFVTKLFKNAFMLCKKKKMNKKISFLNQSN